MDGHDDNFELSPRNHINLVMSLLLDETDLQVDECDDERLKHVIRSLEAELIDHSSSIDEFNGLDSSTTHDDDDDLDLHWMDVEINVPLNNFSCVLEAADQDYATSLCMASNKCCNQS